MSPLHVTLWCYSWVFPWGWSPVSFVPPILSHFEASFWRGSCHCHLQGGTQKWTPCTIVSWIFPGGGSPWCGGFTSLFLLWRLPSEGEGLGLQNYGASYGLLLTLLSRALMDNPNITPSSNRTPQVRIHKVIIVIKLLSDLSIRCPSFLLAWNALCIAV